MLTNDIPTPYQVAKALSGVGDVPNEKFVAKLNAARLHKILDVAYNKENVDGFVQSYERNEA